MKKRLSYHWVIVLACFLMMAGSIGIGINCFPLFTTELMDEFGSTASSVQLIITVMSLTSLLGGAIVGKIMARFTMRIMMPIYAIIMVVAIFMYSKCSSLTMFYITSVLVGFGASGVSIIPCGALINNWFRDKKGLATGIAFTGSVVGGLIFVQVTKNVIAASGWRTAYVVLSIISAVIVLPTVLLLVKEFPKNKGILPLGVTEEGGMAEAQQRGITFKKFLRTGSFWMLAISFFIIGFSNMGLQSNINIALTRTKGMTVDAAANIFSIVMFVQIFGKVLLGAIYDRKGIKFGSIYCMVTFILVVVCFMQAQILYLAIAFAVLFGLTASMTTVTPPYIAANVVGVKDYSTIYGALSLFYGIGVATGPIVAGKIYDSTSSYDIAWIIFAVLSVVTAVTTILAVKKGKSYSEMTEPVQTES